MKSSLVLPLLVLGAAGSVSIATAQLAGTFSATGSMTTPRFEHTATLLTNGKVLIAGGSRSTAGFEPVATAEIYDPSSGTFTATGNMTIARAGHAATLLPDGRVLVTGSVNLAGSAEIYDPSTGLFTAAGVVTRVSETDLGPATLLNNGKVLIAADVGALLWLYDPNSGTFTLTGNAPSYQGVNVNLLPNGQVLVVGFYHDYLYDPNIGAATPTTPLGGANYFPNFHTSTLLADGRVLVAGTEQDGDGPIIQDSAQIYDPSTQAVAYTGNMTTLRDRHTATLLPDGRVLIAGGATISAELYDPSSGTFNLAPDMTTSRDAHTATPLNNGKVLIVGGITEDDTQIAGVRPLSSAELYTPPVLVPAPVLFSLSGDGKGQGAIWNGVTGLIVSPSNPASAGDVLSMYTTSLFEGGVIPPQIAIGGQLAQILFFGDAPDYPGYYQVNVRMPSGVAAGSAISVRLTYLGRPSNAVTIGVQ
jgi:hypothetical protein